VKISGLVCAHNEEARLADCLRRLGFCDEIVVVADRCTDRTSEIARRYDAIVITGIFPLESQRKNAGVGACTGDWIFEVDADEHVDEALAQEVRAVVEREPAGAYFLIPVDNYVGSQRVRHGWGGSFGTSSVARLYRRGSKHWRAQRVHPSVWFEGARAGSLRTPLSHWVDKDIGDMIQRLDRYTALRAQDLADAATPGKIWDNVFRGFRRFYKCYVARKGYREGDLGFLIALMAGLYPVVSCLRAKEALAARKASRTIPDNRVSDQGSMGNIGG
jgi:glycosyltransferase involved in cell wall biosynthesis